MREGGRILATILQLLKNQTKAGMTPKDIAHVASQELTKLGGQPAFLGYKGFPDVICISVNDQVQHSIPTTRALINGDVVNYDFGVRYHGLITDAGISFCLGGQPDADTDRLLTGTQEALKSGLRAVRHGGRVGDISAAIEATLKRYRLGIVRELVGHGVGYQLHEDPEIPNYGLAGQGPELQTGMTLAIEPIANLGTQAIVGDPDGWTLWTADHNASAQFEHTVAVTEDGYKVLTEL